jgi:hypothetical protein
VRRLSRRARRNYVFRWLGAGKRWLVFPLGRHPRSSARRRRRTCSLSRSLRAGVVGEQVQPTAHRTGPRRLCSRRA